ncbi:MAG: hypothetical protein M1812_005131 [Candelaria pacifica]|nr:MAG: hypothetical protein M1812_005131 [Candelaria pacifica]
MRLQEMIPLLTKHLLHISSHSFQPEAPTSFESATQTPFLRLAGQGNISKSLLSQWLTQDKLYALAYVRFIAGLLLKVRLEDFSNFESVSNDHNHNELDHGNDQTLSWRIATCLIGALQNIHREIEFFEDVGRRYGLQLETKDKAPNTEAYIALFDRMTTSSTLMEGMIVLWATEKCYYSAWKYAASFLNTPTQEEQEQGETEKRDLDGGALRTEFISNWTNEAFGKFVDELGDLVDKLAMRESEKVGMKACEQVWKEVLRLEKGFWPALLQEV